MSDTKLPLEIDVQSVKQLRDQNRPFLLLDCRSPAEHEYAAIDGSKLIPMDELSERISELEPNRDEIIVVYCHVGGRSMMVMQWLREMGFSKVQSMAGGIDAWSQDIDESVPRYE